MGVPSVAVVMLLADARLPAGGHVTSNGLEPALLDGLDPRDVRAYMMARADTVVRVEAGTAVVARAGALRGEPCLDAIAAEWAARTPSRAQREIAVSLGTGMRRLARGLFPDSDVVRAVSERSLPRAIVLGAIAAAADLDAATLVRLVAYDDAQTVASALLKLAPGDPLVPARWVLDACAHVEPFVPLLADLTAAEAIPASGAPLIEEWAEAHSSRTRRLFRA